MTAILKRILGTGSIPPSHVPMCSVAAGGHPRGDFRGSLFERLSPSILFTSAELRVLLGFFSVPQVRGYHLDIKVCACVPSVYSRCVRLQLVNCMWFSLIAEKGRASGFCSATASKLITKLLIWKTGLPNLAWETENIQKKEKESREKDFSV